MKAVNVTVRVDEKTKREFDEFCNNVGMNITTAFNMFIKATLRTRQLPFVISDSIDDEERKQARRDLKEAFEACQKQSVINKTDTIAMEEIDAEIAAYRREKREMNNA